MRKRRRTRRRRRLQLECTIPQQHDSVVLMGLGNCSFPVNKEWEEKVVVEEENKDEGKGE